MCWLCQRRTLDRNFLLDHLVMALENQLVDTQGSWAEKMAKQDRWWVEDVAHEEEEGTATCLFRVNSCNYLRRM
ncbi:hypothetical protein Y1Q_0004127 [Alligator mississippiensis]|uniref:Uncharacterized protein n=1 Tax=Alligator mississippiensis TaxID=8496 RepID=A0A151PIE2_ALLMI|nr:hypothetical protein Y1Q_0004127 [Alligator mississippiensis]